MMTDSHKPTTTPMSRVLLATAALLAAFALYRVAEFSVAATHAELAVARATDSTAAGPNDVETHLAQAKSVAEALKKKNLFAPPPPKQNPIREVLGILGNEALINDKWYKAGDSVGDAKILAVEPTKIKVSWNGQETELAPLGSTGQGPGGGPPSGGRGGPPMPPNARGAPGRGRRARSPGPMTEEQAALSERFRNASPEERAKLREEMRARRR